ncbi:MAG: transcriptional repressor [Bacteroidales bacterium]|nr:transcriptional repressor [Bacteroidales bacterium]
MKQEIEAAELKLHGVNPTAVRMLVWRKLQLRHDAFSLVDIEQDLPTVDRSTIFRTLKLFASCKLLHEVDDGTGMAKYCICHCNDEHHHGHVHFACARCQRTFCIENVKIPGVVLPEGFVAEEAEYVIKGLCPECSGKE